ncbi:MAG TPA: symmetrical bis(5'-nucleosyl)-tetraphosphatase [Burkholderiales bacterium]|jgi:bis(5'-nucleosyl)-tetraphosphatase (symmetrical)|nr:symmetrical bis(5'-nucleosyl)-tetraphosphatase [Burkholderiales bacterium]
MATYAIGDVQGCYDQLMRLLERAGYDERRDVLWLVGDLVNRGPQSLATLRFVKGLGNRQVTVLGNHDLAMLVVAAGIRKAHRSDTFGDVLSAPDRDELLAWLRHQKLMHAEGAWAMVHAGLLPQWSIAHALACAGEVEAALRGPAHVEFLKEMYGNEPLDWREDLAGYDRLRIIVNAMTRMRLVAPGGTLELDHKLGPATAPTGYTPWYDHPERASRGTTVIFGHWAALGLLLRDDVVCLDSGCVWGRKLSVLRLEDRRLTDCDCSELAGKARED